ncbi:MAG: IS200/IS605 family transposase [bacterium]|nr:IS200/IS605 family transposase [bacterium]
MATKYWTGAHTTHRLRYHLVILPKYRKRVLKGKIATRIKQLFFQACQINKWWIDELNVQPDHVHLLIQTKPRESLSQVVQLLKGGSSKVIRIEYPELEEYLWGDSFWSDGYFAESVGVVNESVIKNYIKNQHDESMEAEPPA